MLFRQNITGFNMWILVVIFFLTISTITYAQNAGSWATASSIGFTPRFDLFCCELNGKIYAIGGSVPNKIEVFDPMANTWNALMINGSIPFMEDYTATTFNNKIYIIGDSELHVFDPMNDSMTVPITSGAFIRRFSHTSAEVNGKIYVIGGDSGALKLVNTLNVFDPQTNIWSVPSTAGNFTPRTYLCSAVVNGKIYVLGGENDSGQQLNTLEVFDPLTNSWSTPVTIGSFGANSLGTGFGCGVINGRIYVTGASSIVEVFDPLTNIWSVLTPSGTFTSRRFYGSAVANGKLYIMGGLKSKAGPVNINEVFSPPSSGVKKSLDPDADISIYPNPTNGIITIDNNSENIMSISVMNILGETVIELKNLHSLEFILDLSKLVRGTYYVRFASANSVVTKMVVRE
jgi:hypothetical protein